MAKALSQTNDNDVTTIQSKTKPMLELRGKMFNRVCTASIGVWVGLMVYLMGLGLINGASPLAADLEPSRGQIACAVLAAVVAMLVNISLSMLIVGWQFWFDCPHCATGLWTGQPWRCGRCGHDNKPVVVCWGTIVSWCEKCHKKSHTLQCPHCMGMIDLIEGPDRRHPATLIGITPIVPATYDKVESEQEIEQKRKRRREAHAEAILTLEEETARKEAEVKRAMAEAKFNRFIQQQDEGEAAISQLMKEIHGADRRNSILAEYKKQRTAEINANKNLDRSEKRQALLDLEDLVQDAKARYL